MPSIINASVEQLAGEIQRSLDFYLATSGDREITNIYCSGGTANIRALLDAIANRSRSRVAPLDSLLVAQPAGKNIDPLSLQGRTAQAAVAMGLALRKERERNG